MRTYKTVTIERLKVDGVTCNKCGKTCLSDEGGLYAHKGAYRGGYGSDPLEDMAEYHWDLCEPCLKALFDSFVVPVETKGYSVMDELYGVGPE